MGRMIRMSSVKGPHRARGIPKAKALAIAVARTTMPSCRSEPTPLPPSLRCCSDQHSQWPRSGTRKSAAGRRSRPDQFAENRTCRWGVVRDGDVRSAASDRHAQQENDGYRGYNYTGNQGNREPVRHEACIDGASSVL